MRVLHIVNDADMGGAQTLIEQLAVRHRPDESHVLVLMGSGGLSQRLESAATSVTYLGVDKGSVNVINLMRAARRVIQTLSPDIVHSHLLQSDLVAAVSTIGLGVPVISTVHTTGMTSSDPLKSRVLGRVLGPLSTMRMQALVACGSGAHDYMSRRAYPMRRTRTIRNGVDVPIVRSSARSSSFSFLSLARWHPMKDHKTLFEALAIVRSRYPDVTLACAGTGITEENIALMELIEQAGVSGAVTLLGQVEDVRTLVGSVDALVLSSAYGEALPMAGIEALSESTPVIATLLGDCAALLVDPAYGAHPGSAPSLAHAMQHFLGLTEAEHGFDRTRAHGIAERLFNSQDCSAAYRDLYGELSNLSLERAR